MTIHPIEVESYEILRSRVDLSHLQPGVRAVVERVIHASADFDFAETMVVDDLAVRAGVRALRNDAVVVTDVEMVRHGITGAPAVCYLSDVPPTTPDGPTRSAQAMRIAATRHPEAAVVCIGNAPTALFEVLALLEEDAWRPALLIGLPVGFVGAAESKEAARHAAVVPTITNRGEKGGSAVAAAAVNALWRLARAEG